MTVVIVTVVTVAVVTVVIVKSVRRKKKNYTLTTGIYLTYLGLDTCVTQQVLEAAHDTSPV